MINIVITFDPAAPLHFHAASAAASATATDDMMTMNMTLRSGLIAILLKRD
jgi:hypothetical protein